jgi:hypothetical protein
MTYFVYTIIARGMKFDYKSIFIFLPYLNSTSSIRKQIFFDPIGDFLHRT